MAENNCVVCFKNFHIYSVGECDHPVCFECSTRMRVLCRQKECPMCRHEMDKVVFTEKVRPFRRLNKNYALYDKEYQIAFENGYIKDVFESLLHYVCQKCHRAPIFDTFEILKEHMKRVHDLFCCDLCADNLKIFPGEMRYYTKQELSRHQRVGDVDNRSHRGHPLCEFCRVRYLDRDELYKHLRKEHFFCHICDGEGFQQFYGSYSLLRDHYREKHFLCEEGACFDESMTSVFPTEIDLRAHIALVHFRNSRNKLAVRQARTLGLEFALPPRNNDRRGRYGQDGFGEDFPGEQQSNQQQGDDVNLMASLEQNFPSLGNSSSFHAPRPKFTRESNNRLTFNDANFPALGSEMNIKLSNTNCIDVLPSNSVVSTHVSIHVDRKKPKERKLKNNQQINPEPSTSVPSQSWVEKAKEKQAEKFTATSTASSSDSVTKPPAMNRRNFPNLQKNHAMQEISYANASGNKTAKKNKKTAATVFEIDESNLPNMRVNYKEAIVKNAVVKEDKIKKSPRSNMSGDTSCPRKAKEERSLNLNKDNKTHSFLLNANRKKVKMKPEVLIPLNDPNRNHELLPLQTAEPKATSYSSEMLTANGSITSNMKLVNTDEKIRDTSKELKMKDKRGKPPAPKVEESPVKTRPVVCVPKNNTPKKDIRAKTKHESRNSKDKTESADSASTIPMSTSKPPPGFEKLNTAPLPPPPPGLSMLAGSGNANRPPNCALAADNPFVYQQPDEFVQRNSQLIEKIGKSLVEHSEDALNGFKNMSLLFREGFILAADYYLYCIQNIEADKFEDVFVDLIALLPDIFKQQELWAIHQATMPSAAKVENSSSSVDYCTICFQILKLDDATMHYSKHGVTSDTLLQSSSLAKF